MVAYNKLLRALKSKVFKKNRTCNRFRAPRLWSNVELRKFSHLFIGKVINISGWNDSDKEGQTYRDYFKNASAYAITNYSADEDRGIQGLEGEIKLDLEDELPDGLARQYDVSFSHTVLEHIYDVRKAFRNMCLISNDAVITVVPFLQQVHGVNASVGDYWRFTPFTMKKMYEENGLKLRYCSSNGDTSKASIYLFCIGYRKKQLDQRIPYRFDVKLRDDLALSPTNIIGSNMFR